MHSTNCIARQANGKATRGGAETEEEYGRWKTRREAGREEKREDSELISLLAVASLNCLRPPASLRLLLPFDLVLCLLPPSALLSDHVEPEVEQFIPALFLLVTRTTTNLFSKS